MTTSKGTYLPQLSDWENWAPRFSHKHIRALGQLCYVKVRILHRKEWDPVTCDWNTWVDTLKNVEPSPDSPNTAEVAYSYLLRSGYFPLAEDDAGQKVALIPKTVSISRLSFTHISKVKSVREVMKLREKGRKCTIPRNKGQYIAYLYQQKPGVQDIWGYFLMMLN